MMPRRAIFSALFLSVVLLFAAHTPGPASAAPAWAEDPRRSNQGAIMFRLTPQGVVDGRFTVEVRVDTHSGDLADLNLEEATVLRIGGATHRPMSPVKLGGHHARGTMVFALRQVPQNFEIVIKSVGSMGDLTFRWP
jgi:hypothetical protein